jgi:predicted RNA-binding Zn ribbon-like protein
MADTASPFDFVAGDLALDLVNTVGNRLDPARCEDLLANPARLEAWFAAAGLPCAPGLTADDLEQVRILREALHSLFCARADETPLDPQALAVVDAAFRRGQDQRRLALVGDRLEVGWSPTAAALDRALDPVLTAGVERLLDGGATTIRVCEGHGCGWLFQDRSRSGKRRWCSMADCGNRAKAKRHYRRGQGNSSSS